MEKKTSMTLRFTDATLASIEEIKPLVHERTSSKAIVRAIHGFPKLRGMLANRDEEVRRLSYENTRLRGAVSRMLAAQQELKDICSDTN